MMGGLNIC